MSRIPVSPTRVSIAEYLRRESESAAKHEYRDGLIIPLSEAMAGGTYEHSLISANLARAIGNRLRGKPCRVQESDLRVRIPATLLYAYPDVSVICGPPEFDEEDPRGSITNPRLIAEVLSPTTEAYDRGEKFHRYLRLTTLEEDVLVRQHAAVIDTFVRDSDDCSWRFATFRGLEASVTFRSLGIDLPLLEVYADVQFNGNE